MKVSVLIPTMGRRADLLKHVTERYLETIPHENEIIVNDDDATIGAKTNALAKLATGDVWMFGVDDALPHPGWFEAGLEVLRAGQVPAARFLTPGGSPDGPADTLASGVVVKHTRLLFTFPDLWHRVGECIDANWRTDVDHSERIIEAGVQIVACQGFAFTHLNGARDWQTAQGKMRDKAAYRASRVRRGLSGMVTT